MPEQIENIEFRIKENSFIAKLAAWKLQTDQVAIVIGNTIHLHHTSKEHFLRDEKWMRHEMCHIRQFKRFGPAGFCVRYLWESIRHGYFNNKYEVEARRAEEPFLRGGK